MRTTYIRTRIIKSSSVGVCQCLQPVCSRCLEGKRLIKVSFSNGEEKDFCGDCYKKENSKNFECRRKLKSSLPERGYQKAKQAIKKLRFF